MKDKMSANIDLKKQIIVTEEHIERQKQKFGAFLKRLRGASKRADGRRLSCRDVGKVTGLSGQTVSLAEGGNLSLTTFVTLLAAYEADSLVDALALFSDTPDSTVDSRVLKKINQSVALTALEFEHVISLYPDDKFLVSFRAYRDLVAKGYATEIVTKKAGTKYYASVASKED